MTTPKEKKKKSPVNVEAQRPANGTVGEILRAARVQKKMEYDEISAAIHVRPSQLRAIEEGNIAGLPGMTYALGFVKSYATYLKLDAPEIVQKFRAEHAGSQNAGPALHYPEPIGGGPQPNWFVIGIAAFCGVLLLVIWAIFSGGGDKAAKLAEAIPPAPAVGTMTGLNQKVPVPPPMASSLPAPQPAVVPAPVQAAPSPVPVPQQAVPAQPQAPVIVQPVDPARQPAPAAPIKIARGNGRIVLSPNQPSWVEIRDGGHKLLLQKVLRPGEQFYVPDRSGLTLITSNAGGLDVYVDGAQVQPLGGPGEILRGVSLDPDELKKIKTRVRRGQ